MRTFFSRVWLCCSRPSEYYKAFHKKTFWNGSFYLYWLLVLTTFVTMLVAAVKVSVYLPQVRTWIAEAQVTVPTLFPEDLTLTLSGGMLSTNVEEPYVFPFPEEWENALLDEELKHFIVIDTKATVEDFSSYETALLFTKGAMIVKDDQGVRVMLFADHEELQGQSFTMDRARFQQMTEMLLPYLNVLPSILIGCIVAGVLLFPWIVAAFSVVGQWIYLLFFTFVSWIIAMIMGRKTSYGELYRFGFYVSTLGILLSLIVSRIYTWPIFASTGVDLLMMILVLRSFPKGKK